MRTPEVEKAISNTKAGMYCTDDADTLAAEVERLEAHLKGAMQDGGYEYFVRQLRNAQQQAHNAVYVAEQLEKKVEKLEALDELTTNQAKEYLQRVEAAEARVKELEADIVGMEAFEKSENALLNAAVAERDTLRDQNARLRALAFELASSLGACAGYIASVRTDRQITQDENVYALQTLEWAEGAVEVAQYANAALEAYDKALNGEEASK